MVWVIDNILTFVELLTSVATSDPISAVLVTLGGLIFALSFSYFGYLTLGGLLSAVLPDVDRSQQPKAGH